MKVLIVDDSAFMRKVISDMVKSIGGEVVGLAKDGAEAIKLVKELRPDVVTLDVEMPSINGLDALRTIMTECPTPVVMLSMLTREGANETMEALRIGAVDFISKPSSLSKMNSPEMLEELRIKIKAAASSKVSALVRKPSFQTSKSTGGESEALFPFRSPTSANKVSNRFSKIVAIGISTGGPRALQEVIPALPGDFPAPILIVQHMPAGFTRTLAESLDAMSKLTVKEAKDGEPLNAGVVYISPGNKHLKISKQMNDYVVQLNDEDRVNGHRPSVDVLFDSLAELDSISVVAAVMTGMGSDGAQGAKNLKDSGAFVLAQDEASSVVFGMPKSAIKLEATDVVVSLDRIAAEIKKAVEV